MRGEEYIDERQAGRVAVAHGFRHGAAAAVASVAFMAWFELTPTDVWVQNLFYDAVAQRWALSRTNAGATLLLYDGPKLLLAAFALSLAVLLALPGLVPRLRAYRSGIRVVLLSLVLVPASCAALKEVNAAACPRDLLSFGGHTPYVHVVEAIAARRPAGQTPCFPAAHASGGFALMSLYFLFRQRRAKRIALAAGIVAGWSMGLYKIAIGDHFLSHTVMSMLLAWWIVNMLAIVEQLFAARLRDGPRRAGIRLALRARVTSLLAQSMRRDRPQTETSR